MIKILIKNTKWSNNLNKGRFQTFCQNLKILFLIKQINNYFNKIKIFVHHKTIIKIKILNYNKTTTIKICKNFKIIIKIKTLNNFKIIIINNLMIMRINN